MQTKPRRRGFQPRTAPIARLQSAPTGKRFFRKSNSIFMISLFDSLRACPCNVRGGQAPALRANKARSGTLALQKASPSPGHERGGQAPALRANKARSGTLALQKASPSPGHERGGQAPALRTNIAEAARYRPGSSPTIRTVSKLTVSTRPIKSTI